MFYPVLQVAAPGAKRAVFDCILFEMWFLWGKNKKNYNYFELYLSQTDMHGVVVELREEHVLRHFKTNSLVFQDQCKNS